MLWSYSVDRSREVGRPLCSQRRPWHGASRPQVETYGRAIRARKLLWKSIVSAGRWRGQDQVAVLLSSDAPWCTCPGSPLPPAVSPVPNICASSSPGARWIMHVSGPGAPAPCPHFRMLLRRESPFMMDKIDDLDDDSLKRLRWLWCHPDRPQFMRLHRWRGFLSQQAAGLQHKELKVTADCKSLEGEQNKQE